MYNSNTNIVVVLTVIDVCWRPTLEHCPKSGEQDIGKVVDLLQTILLSIVSFGV